MFEAYSRRELIDAALRSRCHDDGMWRHTRRSRLLYTVKAVVAVLIGRTKETRYRRRGAVSEWDTVDPVEVAYLRGGSDSTFDGTSHWFECLQVPKGLRRWWYEIDHDST